MDSKKSNKITEIVRLQQIIKKWRKLANSSTSNGGSRSIKLLRKTISFSDKDVTAAAAAGGGGTSSNSKEAVPKGFLAVCVGEELKRFVIPMEYLGHKAFGVLLKQAEEEFGFQQAGVLRIPCQVSMFERILKLVKEKDEQFLMVMQDTVGNCCSSQSPTTHSHHPQSPMCR